MAALQAVAMQKSLIFEAVTNSGLRSRKGQASQEQGAIEGSDKLEDEVESGRVALKMGTCAC